MRRTCCSQLKLVAQLLKRVCMLFEPTARVPRARHVAAQACRIAPQACRKDAGRIPHVLRPFSTAAGRSKGNRESRAWGVRARTPAPAVRPKRASSRSPGRTLARRLCLDAGGGASAGGGGGGRGRQDAAPGGLARHAPVAAGRHLDLRHVRTRLRDGLRFTIQD